MTRLRNLGARIGSVRTKLSLKKRADPFYLSPEWRHLAAFVLQRDGGRCAVPGCETADLRVAVDHIIEIRDGGAPLDPQNLRLLCQPHHNAKTAANAARRTRGG